MKRSASSVTELDRNDPLIVDVMALSTAEHRWFEKEFSSGLRWEYFHQIGPGRRLAVTRACWAAVKAAHRQVARLLISHDPRVTFRCGLFNRLARQPTPHIAWDFNFVDLPQGSKRRLMSLAFRSVDRFIVFSTMEKQLYAEHFNLPIDRFEMTHWAVGEPLVSKSDVPIEAGDYICSLGGNARDYPTLMAAMARLPEVRLVAVVRPKNLEGLTIPPNVTVRTNISVGECNNILKYSRFTVVPLRGSQIPCGHVTVVAAMHLGIAIVTTRSSGLDDYIRDGFNALTFEARSPDDLVIKIRQLWEDRAMTRALAENGRQFAADHCAEQSMRDTLAANLERFGLASKG